MTDKTIVQAYLDRDETAISMTQKVYGSYLHAIAIHILDNRSDADESVNDTYFAAWNSIPPHTPIHLSTYLGKIARRISIDRYRHRHRDKRQATEYAVSLSEREDTLTTVSTPESETDSKVLQETIRSFVRSLNIEDRRLFLGRYYYFDPLQTVAAYCGLSESNAKTKLFRLRERLRTYLQKEGFTV